MNGKNIKQIEKCSFDGLTGKKHYFCNDKCLEEIPKNFFKDLTSIEKIDFSSKKIKYLNKSTFNGLTNLIEINFYGNIIKELPENLFKDQISLEKIESNF